MIRNDSNSLVRFTHNVRSKNWEVKEFNKLRECLEPGDRVKWMSTPFTNEFLRDFNRANNLRQIEDHSKSADVLILTQLGYLINFHNHSSAYRPFTKFP